MKNNQIKLSALIINAIGACKDDYVFAETKQLLYRALELVNKVSNKRESRKSQAKIFEEEAKKRNEKWNEMLKKGMKLDEKKSNDQSSQ